MTIIKSLFILMVISAIHVSCNSVNKPNLNDIKTKVFGGLVLGESLNFNKNRIIDLVNRNEARLTVNTELPYIILKDPSSALDLEYYMFPSLGYAADTVVNRIEYFVFAKNNTYKLLIENPELRPSPGEFTYVDDEELFRRYQDVEQKIERLKNDFQLTTDTDPVIRSRYPMYGLSNKLENDWIVRFLTKEIKKSYPQDPTEETIDKKEETAFKYQIKRWTTDKITISIIKCQVYGGNASTIDNNFTILVYEFTPEISKKYNLINTTSKF